MIEYKQGVAARVSVRMLDSTGTPVTGLAFGVMSASIEKADGTTSNMVMSGANWIEVTGGAFSGKGKYDLVIPSSMTDQTGVLVYVVSTASAETFLGIVKVVANEEVDTYTAMTRALGLMHENSVLDQTAYNGDNKLTSGRLRIYDSKANAQGATSTGLIATYTITATYSLGNVQTYTVVREP